MEDQKLLGEPGTVKVRPATALPWLCDPTGDCGPDWIGVDGHFVFEGTERLQDATYTTHAANAYPKLVEALRNLLPICSNDGPLPLAFKAEGNAAEALLRDLGEES